MHWFKKVKHVVFDGISGIGMSFVDTNIKPQHDKSLKDLFSMKKVGDTLFITKEFLINYNGVKINLNVKDLSSITFVNSSLKLSSENDISFSPKLIVKESRITIVSYFQDHLNIELFNSKVFITKAIFVKNLYLDLKDTSSVLIDNGFINNAYIYVDSTSDYEKASSIYFYKNVFVREAELVLTGKSKALINVFENLNYFICKESQLSLRGIPSTSIMNAWDNEYVKSELPIFNDFDRCDKKLNTGKKVFNSFDSPFIGEVTDSEIEQAFVKTKKNSYLCYPFTIKTDVLKKQKEKALFIKTEQDKDLKGKRYKKEQEEKLELKKQDEVLRNAEIEKIAAIKLKEVARKDDLSDLLVILDSGSPTDYITAHNRVGIIKVIGRTFEEDIDLSKTQYENRKKLCMMFDIEHKGKPRQEEVSF